MRTLLPTVTLFLAAAPGVALAQAAPESAAAAEPNVFDGDRLTVGVGGIYGPSYKGSDDSVLVPVPLVQGSLRGVAITPRAGGIALDLVPDGKDARIGLSLGPVATLSGNRNRQIKDPVVRAAGKLKRAIDLGANAGVTAYRLLNPYDSLTLSTDVTWNANNAHRGMIVSPRLTYVTPLSRAALVTLSLGADHVDGDYARYYFDVSPAQSAASGLPLYRAKGGWASLGGGALVGYDLDGDLRNGGFALFALGGYQRLLNDARANPYTAIRGSADQWTAGAGIAYTF
ncbi:MAG: MipA/OmpV family protein [Novosphingobium sp.]|nr:MipA/OmpV family protein [Novosphingobium sp.]